MGVEYSQIENQFDETPLENETALAYVERLALGKANSAKENFTQFELPILAADTIVVLEGDLLGKPKDLSDAEAMLTRLSGKQHEVLTSVVLLSKDTCIQKTSKSRVTFESLNNEKIVAYCNTEEPLGKAGSYAIQGVAASFISLLEGSYSGVMGLPLNETRQMLDEMGVKYLLNPALSC